MMKAKKRAGLTLVEILFGLAVVTIIMNLLYQLLVNTGRAEARVSAQSTACDQAADAYSWVHRDLACLHYDPVNATVEVTDTPQCPGGRIQFTRLADDWKSPALRVTYAFDADKHQLVRTVVGQAQKVFALGGAGSVQFQKTIGGTATASNRVVYRITAEGRAQTGEAFATLVGSTALIAQASRENHTWWRDFTVNGPFIPGPTPGIVP
jgi:type II secretory pathway pseudopilin PulG